MEDRIHKPGCVSDTFIKRELVEMECKPIPHDVPLAFFTGPRPCDFELNPEIFPPTHRKVEYRREAPGSDWFVRVDSL